MASPALLKAVSSGRLTQTQLMLQMGAEVNCRDSKGRTALICALGLPNPKTRITFLRLLLKAGAQVSLCDDSLNNALMWACSVGSVKDVRLLLRRADVELDLNAQNSEGQTALWIAVQGGRTEIVLLMLHALSKMALNFEVEDYSGVTPAMLAARLGRVNCLRAMIRCVDSSAKSVSTLLNLTKINRILKSRQLAGFPETSKEACLEKRLEDDGQISLKRITSTEGYPGHTVLRPNVKHTQSQSNDNSSKLPVISINNCTTPVSSTSILSLRYGSGHQNAGSVSSSSDGHKEEHSIQLPPLQNVDTTTNHSFQNGGDLLNMINGKYPSFQPKMSESSDKPEVVVLPPVSGPALSSDSVRRNLPHLFDIFAQQTSSSFRKTAERPPSPPPPSKRKTGAKWSKLKGLSLIAGIGKAETSLSPTSANRSPDAVKNQAGGLLKVFMGKRRSSGTPRQHDE